jgi:glycosyltransferase involved in cell wall biosynthesis
VRVAYFSPLPPERTGISDYSALLVPALRRRINVRIVRRGARRPPRGSDIALYHVGNNSPAHEWIVRALKREPGVVVLHEHVIHHLVAGMTLGRGDIEQYLDALEHEAGASGRLLGQKAVDGLIPPLWQARAPEFPLTHWVLEHARGVVVHSRFAERGARAAGYDGPVWRVSMPAWPSPSVPAEHGLPAGRFPVVGCFGRLNEAKRLPEMLEAFARLTTRFPTALLVLAGSIVPQIGLEERLGRLGLVLGRNVLHLDYVPEQRLWALIARADVCINLRAPTMGETSGMVIRILSVGTPIVVSDIGWFSELPDSVAAKVPVDEWEVEHLASVLELLAGDDDLRRRMGEAAADYARNEHDLEQTAELYVAALESCAGWSGVRDAVLGEVARAAHDVGLTADSPELAAVGTGLRELGFDD